MMRVTVADLVTLPPELLARLLLECAGRDPGLLSRLHDSVTARAGSALPARQPELTGDSLAMKRALKLIERFARTDEPVLITGESGTGREVAAQAIHDGSSRYAGPFVAVNCGAIPANLIAPELFGLADGAVSGTGAQGQGHIERAQGGTLFLNEIGELPLDVQGHLLRFLKEGRFLRIGGREAVRANVRVVAATNVRLHHAIADGRFLEDLYYRLNVLLLALPPLRERGGDVEVLARHFLKDAARHFARDVIDFEPAALEALRRYSWPGNIPELQAIIRRAVVIGDGPVLRRADLVGLEEPREEGGASPAFIESAEENGTSSRPQPGSAEERLALLNALACTNENVTLTAQELGVSRVTLYRMLRRHSIRLHRGLRPAPAIG